MRWCVQMDRGITQEVRYSSSRLFIEILAAKAPAAAAGLQYLRNGHFTGLP